MLELETPRTFAVVIKFGKDPMKRVKAVTDVLEIASVDGTIKRFMATSDLSALGVFIQSKHNATTIFHALNGSALKQQTPAIGQGDEVTIMHAAYDHQGNSNARALSFLSSTTRQHLLGGRK